MPIQLIFDAKMCWKKYKAELYFAAALAAAISAVDLILRWDEFYGRIDYLLLNVGITKLVFVYSVVLLLLVLTIFGLRASFRWGRQLTSVCIFALIATNLMYLDVMKEYLSHKDLNIIISNSDLVFSAVTSFYSAKRVGVIILLFVGMYLFGAVVNRLITRKSEAHYFSTLKSIMAMISLVFVHYVVWSTLYVKLNNFPIDPVSHSLRAMAFLSFEYNEFYSVPREKLDSTPIDEKYNKPHIVYIIDESIRYDYLGINNSNHDTTPFLSNLDDPRFYNLGLGISAATCSFSTRSLLLTGVNEVPDVRRKLLSAPTIFQYARHLNYHSVLINAANDQNFPNIVTRKPDMDFIDEAYMAKDIPATHKFTDLSSVPLMHEILERKEPQFIVLVKKGAHFHYENQYPKNQKEFEYFFPHLDKSDSYDAKREKMINSYKNTIRFTVDHFSEKLYSKIPKGVSMIYTSDHGQSLQENGQTYTHCKHEVEQSLVPVLMLSDHPWMKTIESKYGKKGDPIISHYQLFPTLVALMSGNKDYTHNEYFSLFANNKEQAPLKYSSGGLWSFSNEVFLSASQLYKYINFE